MLNIYQKTIKDSVSFEGIGLHTGLNTKVKITPGASDQGIVFKDDLKNNNFILANYKNVSSAKLCTTLQNEYGVKISTVEHLLAALYILEIDNAIIEVNNEELPIMDGSAKDFILEIEKVGTKKLSKKRKNLKILKKIQMIHGNKNISIEPDENSTFEVDFQLNYENKIIGKQRNTINFCNDDLKMLLILDILFI